MPNLALIEGLKNAYPATKIYYFGSYLGMERHLVAKDPQITYQAISTGKLRRYLSLKNFFDLFRFGTGVIQAYLKLKHISPKPTFIFSKGGYVSLPVILAGAMLKIPIIIQESDISPGLTTRISLKFCTEAWFNYEEAANQAKNLGFKGTIRVMPTLVRPEISKGQASKALEFLGQTTDPAVKAKYLLVLGGSSGAESINKVIDLSKAELNKAGYRIIHVCGHGKMRPANPPDYYTYEFLGKELPDFLALADLIISRSGASTLAELAIINKPTILIPLSTASSRGEQLGNAQNYVKKHPGVVLEEQELTCEVLLKEIAKLVKNQGVNQGNSASNAEELLNSYLAALNHYFVQIS
jgi:UDP-N-acetylglucosamine--N-acetylmuramyl-(pentapeptide) pyrophosphoryl-undecaprenol N-acetylglucosamine transferase